MTDVQSIVEELRSFCQSNDQALTDGLRETAQAYRAACQAVNQRLRRCEDFLHKGLRSEAIQLAEADPPLLDALAVLDFPERAQWDEIAATYGLPPAPKLNVATAEALNRAYGEEEPLRVQLRVHRWLNLARAPLRDRLAALRRLRQSDSTNPVWSEDIRVFEAARHRELQEEIEAAITARNFAALAACWDEVQTAPWLTEPPQSLVSTLRGAFLKQVGKELYDAYKSLDFPRAQGLRNRWNHLCPRVSELSVNASIPNRVSLALEWVSREEGRQANRLAYEAALTDLEHALGGAATRDQLRELWLKVTAFRRTVPAKLGERYSERMKELRSQADSRERLILAITFSVGAVILVGFLLFVTLHAH
jgi:hypothetical protein